MELIHASVYQWKSKEPINEIKMTVRDCAIAYLVVVVTLLLISIVFLGFRLNGVLQIVDENREDIEESISFMSEGFRDAKRTLSDLQELSQPIMRALCLLPSVKRSVDLCVSDDPETVDNYMPSFFWKASTESAKVVQSSSKIVKILSPALSTLTTAKSLLELAICTEECTIDLDIVFQYTEAGVTTEKRLKELLA